MSDFGYDIETYKNAFTMIVKHVSLPLMSSFEISDRINDSQKIIDWCSWAKTNNFRMVGFNNVGFDYPVIHQLLKMGKSDANTLYQKAAAIIGSQDNEKFQHLVYPSDRYVEQIDLFKIHHFDNKARATSLKILEFQMKMKDLRDLPFKPGSTLTFDQIDTLKSYNEHDVDATIRFYHESLDKIRFREELTIKYGRDFMNHNDTKIGKDYFLMELEKSGVQIYDYGQFGRKPRQSKRIVIDLNDAILPSISFNRPEFQQIVDWLRQQKIRETKGVFKDLVANVDGFQFVFGTGGIHGSVESKIIEADDDFIIESRDVTSYYPNLAISNGFYPEHMGQRFCEIYKDVYEMRKKYPKGSAENAMLKLALNGTYGDSNNQFSPFYDPLFTMKITLNGQLLLCKLVEHLIKVPTLKLCMINTDGVEYIVNKKYKDDCQKACDDWERETGLELEEAFYSQMFIRDCNNYLAVYTDGKVKRKGAYDSNYEWHQNSSAAVVPKVAEQSLVHGKSIRETVMNWPDSYDFMLRTKVPRTGYLALDNEQIQNISRYYVAKGGRKLWKWLQPMKGKTEWRKFAINSGWGVQVCNDLDDFGKLPIDYEFYIQEVEKLVLGLS